MNINIFIILFIVELVRPLADYSLLIAQDAYISDFKVNDDATTQEQRYSKIGVDSAGNFVVAWDDDRNFTNNSWHQVYCQVFDKWGNRIGNNFRIGQDTTLLVDIAVLKDGRFLIYWINLFRLA